MKSDILNVQSLGKSYAEWESEWLRFGSWLGLPFSPQREVNVLDDVSFSVSRGESIGIVGKNGAGKSTLLKIVTGTLAPTRGGVSKSGKISSILELGMGFQSELTGRENAYQISGLMGRSRAEVDAVIADIESFADIGDAFDHPVRTYSSGMQARVAFAVATAIRPDLLIVDEALTVGDAFFQAKCYERIKRYRDEGMAVLLVSHSVADIVRNCDRAILLSNGRLKMDGHPRDVTNVYLDEIFGKRTEDPTSIAAELTEEHGQGAAENATDLLRGIYEQRPLYRKEEYRWGNGQAVISDYLVVSETGDYPAIIECGERVRFSFRCLFKQGFDNVVPGIMIKTLDGVFVYGTNSLLLNDGWRHIAVAPGDERVFEFSLPFSLNAGDYLISLGVAAGESVETLVPLDRRYDSIILTATRQSAFTGLIDLGANLLVHQ
ncbi:MULTISPECIES: ABC transporter ATP-binding protein [unclassified Pseudoxanthomonas]|uniref:ABC transporter ATP-binding protein n=1 Tax=unclassified Pseudoxanthomonas TaxID=2645906 RepID=UPI003077AE29